MDHANTAQRMAEAASNFLASLDEAERQKAVIDFADSTERENWHYIPRERAGASARTGSDRSQCVGLRKSLDDHFAGADPSRIGGSRAALPARSRSISREHFRRAGGRRALGLAL